MQMVPMKLRKEVTGLKQMNLRIPQLQNIQNNYEQTNKPIGRQKRKSNLKKIKIIIKKRKYTEKTRRKSKLKKIKIIIKKITYPELTIRISKRIKWKNDY